MDNGQRTVGRPRVSIVVAASDNHVIGYKGELPWNMPSDLKRFKQLTMGHCLLMGRKTYESIGRPLPGRVSIVLSRTLEDSIDEQILVVRDPIAAIGIAPTVQGMKRDELFVIGGGEIYRQVIPFANRIYLTRVHTTVEGDAFFPELNPAEWHLTESERCPANDRNEHACTFETYERIPLEEL